MADGYLNFDTKINEKGFNDGISKLGSLGKSGLSIVSKAMTGAIAAVGTGAAAIIKSSLGVVANMEQQVGGVETPSALFISELDNTCTDVLAFAVTTFDPAIILVIFLLTDFTDVIFLFNLATLLDKSLFYTERRYT